MSSHLINDLDVFVCIQFESHIQIKNCAIF